MKKITLLLGFLIASCIGYAQTIESITKAKPFEVSGSIGGNLGLYSVTGVNDRTSPFQYGLSARLNFKVYGISIPLYAAIRDNSFNYGGSFQRIRISPEYKWIKLYIGDNYVNFNPYTLNGRTVNGYGIELKPGKFRFKYLRGKVEDLRSYQDSLQLGTIFSPTYTRKVSAMAIGYGTSGTHFDIYAVNSADRLDSLNGEVIIENVTRKSNTVLGSTFSLKIMKGINFRSNFGVSFQTDNLDAFGENGEFVNNPLTSGSLIESNLSSRLLYAGDVGLNYSNRLFSLNGQVKYVQPFFQPLTVAFINSDIINYTVGGSTSFFNRRLNIMGSVGIQKNNLTGQKLSTANNAIVNLASNFRLGKSVTGTFTYTNFTQDYEARLIQINDIYTYAINSNVLSGSLRYVLKNNGFNYRFSIKGGQNSFLTVDDSEEDLNAYDSWNAAFAVGASQTSRDMNINTSITYRKYNRTSSTLANYGLSVNASKGFYDSKLKFKVNTAFIYNDRDELREGNTWRNGFSTTYSINKKSNLGLRISHIRRKSTIRSDFNEYRFGVQYMHNIK